MELLALVLLFPLVWPFVAKGIFKHEITLRELGLNLVIVVAAVAALWLGGRYAQSADYEVLNGQVTGKRSEHVSCEHSYSCNCDKDGQNCSTCYDHSYDIDWLADTTAGEVEVPRIDRRGTSTPPRWEAVKVGDPVAIEHRHTNYIKGAPDSLFSAVAEQTALTKYGNLVPAYPLEIYDLHYLNRVLAQGVTVSDLAEWNKDLSLRLRPLGPTKQVNWVVLITNSADPGYADAVRVKWLGGKKNDVVVVLGAPEYPKLAWTRVLSWTDKELFKVQLRDDLLKLENVDRTAVLDLLEQHTKTSFVRKHMADFDYLANEIRPPTWLTVLAGVLGVVGSLFLSFYLANNNERSFGGSPFNRSRGRLRRR